MFSIEQLATLKGATVEIRSVKRFELIATMPDGTESTVAKADKKAELKNLDTFLASALAGDAE